MRTAATAAALVGALCVSAQTINTTSTNATIDVANLTVSASEPSNFDPATALADIGVNVSAIIPAEALSKRGTNLCSYTCAALSILFHGHVVTQGSSAYDADDTDYWSQQQAEVDPYCIFYPQAAADVSVGILLARLTQCPFAVKSGGHAAFAGASNIQGGVTYNMEALNSITLSSDKKTAYLGTGNTWYDVYTALQNDSLAVVGGRVAAIGVGGLTLGGGISFFSGLYGWACDNVNNYEVVTADGLIINVNTNSYSDLYFALRGGGNNFGIVTRFDVPTFEQGLMWGGSRDYLITEQATILSAFESFGQNAPSDPNAALIVAFAYAGAEIGYIIAVDFEYALPEPDPPIFDPFLNATAIADTTTVQSLSDITIEFNETNPSGLRETYWTATYLLNETLANYIVDVFINETTPIEDAAGIVPACVLQVITTDQLSHMSKNGGNALGIEDYTQPLMLLNLAYMWDDEADDERIQQANSNIVKQTVAQAEAWGLGVEYLYMNYASQYQNVIPSYGSTNFAKLKSIATKYDPTGVFQTLQPGYFKLNGAAPSSGP